MKILIATTNPGKLTEFKGLLAETEISFVTPTDLGIDTHINETGTTYLENATLKAVTFCQVSGLPALSDDTGLEVNALNGFPGALSARLIPGQNATDADRRRKLLSLLQNKPRPWLAHFHCTVVLALPDGCQMTGNGDCVGEIIPQERGSHGFGYDPIFYLPDIGRTMAELSTSEKNALSHRARAVKELLSKLPTAYLK